MHGIVTLVRTWHHEDSDPVTDDSHGEKTGVVVRSSIQYETDIVSKFPKQ